MKAKYELWAMLYLNNASEENLRQFFAVECRIPARDIRKNLHATIYHARRELPGLIDSSTDVCVRVPGSELRLMVMAPGGENPRPKHDPQKRSIGIRIRRAGGATTEIEGLRAQFYSHETPRVLGDRLPSSKRRSAFGAHHYQPHISVLRPGGWPGGELSEIGGKLRAMIDEILFDKLVVCCRRAAG